MEHPMAAKRYYPLLAITGEKGDPWISPSWPGGLRATENI